MNGICSKCVEDFSLGAGSAYSTKRDICDEHVGKLDHMVAEVCEQESKTEIKNKKKTLDVNIYGKYGSEFS